MSRYGYALGFSLPGAYIFTDGSTFVDLGLSTVLIPVEQWTHVALTCDGTTAKCWINSVSETTTNPPSVSMDGQ